MKLLSSVLAISIATAVGGFTFNSMQSENAGYEQQAANHWGSHDVSKSYILQGSNSARLNKVVANVGGNVSREFPIINAVAAMLTSQQADEIRELGGVRIQDDRTVMTMGLFGLTSNKSTVINNNIAQQVGANHLHDEGITGAGITVAVVDSGANMGGTIGSHLFRNTEGKRRVSVKYDAFRKRKTYFFNDDRAGHGSHISGIIASSLKDDEGNYNGIAPDVSLLSIKAFNEEGESSYSKVLDSLNWIFENRYKYKIRVVNMSLGAEVQSYYWNDPINQAIMRLWEAGVVVVSSAGNNGEDEGVTVPGNNPYVITVGAATDNQTPLDFSDDRVASFSSKGPTAEGFIKPEVVAYGSQIASKMDERYFISELTSSMFGDHYTQISGTSQSSALVSGIAALIIANDPTISPDDVKCRIMATARTANNGETMTYSPFAQGAGLVNAYAAVKSTATNCANRGLNIEEDLMGTNHFKGPAGKNDEGQYYLDLGNGKLMIEGNHWGSEAMGVEGNHWGSESMGVQGNHWGSEVMGVEGNHWGSESMGLEGNHWGSEVMGVQGNHWGSESMGLEGNHWGNEAMGLESFDWESELMGVESNELNLPPIDPSLVVPLDEAIWE